MINYCDLINLTKKKTEMNTIKIYDEFEADNFASVKFK